MLRIRLQLVKKVFLTFLTALLPPRILPGEQNAITRKSLKNQPFSDGGLLHSRRALPPRAPLLLTHSSLNFVF
jgi:hypothetical protein